MTYDQIFTAFYSLYRADADVPTSADDEYTIGMRLANEAVNRWANYEGVYWKELFTTHQIANTGDQVIATGDRTYAAPTTMREAGGWIRVNDSAGNAVQRYDIIDPEEVQSRSDLSTYAYFTGNPSSGYTLNINPAPPSSLNGLDIDFVFYKKPTEFTTGASTTEMANPYFIVHRMLAQQFRASRNPYYTSALRDAEDALKNMKLDNDSGTWSNPWQLPDRSGAQFGDSSGVRGW